jgi:prophage regulatory protein
MIWAYSIIVHGVTHMAEAIHRAPALLRRKEVQTRTGLARSTIYQHIKAGTFPKPVPLVGRAVGWVESEVNEWIAERIKIGRDEIQVLGD